MIWDKMGCINGCMVKSNLVISLVPYTYYSLTLVEKAIIFWFLGMVNWQELHNLPTHKYKIETLADLIKNEDVKASFVRHRQN